jgi:hypothetical protein
MGIIDIVRRSVEYVLVSDLVPGWNRRLHPGGVGVAM